jgi:hypothetical protein
MRALVSVLMLMRTGQSEHWAEERKIQVPVCARPGEAYKIVIIITAQSTIRVTLRNSIS